MKLLGRPGAADGGSATTPESASLDRLNLSSWSLVVDEADEGPFFPPRPGSWKGEKGGLEAIIRIFQEQKKVRFMGSGGVMERWHCDPMMGNGVMGRTLEVLRMQESG